MAVNTMDVSHMINSAIASPEAGIINFNILRDVLTALNQTHNIDAGGGGGGGKLSANNINNEIADLQKKFDQLADLPTTNELFSKKEMDNVDGTSPVGKNYSGAKDMWQAMQLKKRVDANQNGIDKLMSMMDEMMSKVTSANQRSIDNENLINKLNKDKMELQDALDELRSSQPQGNFVTWDSLEDYLKGIKEEFESKHRMPEMTEIGTSPRTMTPPASLPPSRPVSGRPTSARISSRPTSAGSNNSLGPSEHLKSVLEELGQISDEHLRIKERVVVLETEMPLKANKDDIPEIVDNKNSGETEELIRKQKALEEMLSHLKSVKNKDSDIVKWLQNSLKQQQKTVDQLAVDLSQVVEDNQRKIEDISRLSDSHKRMDSSKAERHEVEKAVNEKASIISLNEKVNSSIFDRTISDMNNILNDIIAKFKGHDDDWKSIESRILKDVDGKVDRLEFNPVKEELEKQLRNILRQLKLIDRPRPVDDEAAGTKLCLSCDRQVEQSANAVIAAVPGMTSVRSQRVYHTFELDQIRQQCKQSQRPATASVSYPRNEGGSSGPLTLRSRPMSCRSSPQKPGTGAVHSTSARTGQQSKGHQRYCSPRSMNTNNVSEAAIDPYATNRQCGGMHTSTYPHRRSQRVTGVWGEEEKSTNGPLPKKEVDIIGANGQIYRGGKQTKLNISTPKKPHNTRYYTEDKRPNSAQISRPSTPRMTSRPQSASTREVRGEIDDIETPEDVVMTAIQNGLTAP